jgi:hypothetical protein
MTDQHAADMTFLMEQPQFRRFLFRSIQTSGLLSHIAYGTNGSDGRDLAFNEGRRSLGFELLSEAEAALPAAARHPLNIVSLMSVLREEAQTTGQEKTSGGRNDRYGNGDRDRDGDD